MDPVLKALDLQGVKDLPGELGAFSVESLFVRYNFTYDELLAALEALPRADDAPEPLKTVVHETTHLFHTTTTPFGFLVYALRRLQASLVADAINDLRGKYRITIRYPLVDFVFGLPQEVHQYIRPYLAAWYAAELFIMMALDNFEAWSKHLVTNPLLLDVGGSPARLFALIQRHLATNYREHARKLRAARREPESGGDPLPFESFQLDSPGDAALRKHETYVIATQTLMDDCNMIFVAESAGTTSESWKTAGLGVEGFWTHFQTLFDKRGIGNQFAVRMLRGSIPAQDGKSFVLSYLALCELCLFGPVLPHHRHFRKDGVKLLELLPFFRWLELLNAAPKVRPMQALTDYERYTQELCAALGWVSPREIVQFTVTSHVAMENDIHESMYLTASHYRARTPWVFHDYTDLLTSSDPAQRPFALTFTFPVVQYADRTEYLSDKERLMTFTRWYLLRRALRAILLRDRIEIRMPYRPKDDAEVGFLREMLLQDLQLSIGIRVSDLTLA